MPLILSNRGKISFLQWGATGYTSHTPGQAPCLGVADQNKMNSIVFLQTTDFLPTILLHSQKYSLNCTSMTKIMAMIIISIIKKCKLREKLSIKALLFKLKLSCSFSFIQITCLIFKRELEISPWNNLFYKGATDLKHNR